MASVIVTLRVRLPWWSKAYVFALQTFQQAGLIEVDPEIALAFIARHMKIEEVDPKSLKRPPDKTITVRL